MLPVYDLSKPAGRDDFEARLRRLRQSAELQGRWRDTAAELIDAVRDRGDEAIVEQMRRWTDPEFTAERIRVSPGELERADRALDPDLRGAIERSIQHVRAYQQHVMPVAPEPITIDGAELGLRYTPVGSAGLLVPENLATNGATPVAARAPGESIVEQTEDILKRIDELLSEAGTDKSRILSATIWLSDIRAFDEMNEVWDAWTAPDAAPARACVEAKLAFPHFNVEIGVVAAR